MKNIIEYMTEKFRLRDDTRLKSPVIPITKFHPMTKMELVHIIDDRIAYEGVGTEESPIDFNDVDISAIRDLSFIFQKMDIEYIDVSHWDTSNVIKMMSMFDMCKNLKSIGDISGWDVSKVDNFARMFWKCKNLDDVGDLKKWNINLSASRLNMFTHAGDIAIPTKWII